MEILQRKDILRHTTTTGSRPWVAAENTFLGTETGSRGEDRYEPTLDQLHEAEEVLRLEDLKSSLRSLMEELEARYGAFAFSVAPGHLR
ncbi:hypothetical protein V1525DRAFT_391595 [Lipomyces kononenkoae]|uniref:Uncharacterized protein n=1 Tax=Lipomyces kononenkoae TaxID=34357 RepID=A0ACC3SRN4_LIPKO